MKANKGCWRIRHERVKAPRRAAKVRRSVERVRLGGCFVETVAFYR